VLGTKQQQEIEEIDLSSNFPPRYTPAERHINVCQRTCMRMFKAVLFEQSNLAPTQIGWAINCERFTQWNTIQQ